MNIAIFTDVFLEVPGGIPSSINAQRESLEKLGHKVTVFCPGFKAPDKGVVIVPTHPKLRLNGAPLSKSPETVEKWVLEHYPVFSQFDIVHVHYEASCSLAGMRLARQFKIPLVQTMHGREDMAIAVNVPHPFKTIAALALNFLHKQYIPHPAKVHRDHKLAPTLARATMWTLMISHANFVDQVITPSEHFAKKLKTYGVKKPISVVSNGVADGMVVRAEKLAEESKISLTRELQPGKPLKLFWNSRLSHEKRIMPFLEALSLMKESFFFSACGDGNALSQAETYVKNHNLSDKVKFYGRVLHEEVLAKMQNQHLSVTVSYGFDTQGLTLLEAEAVGLPVFFCDPDMQEAVPKSGALQAKGPSPQEMAEALDNIARHPEQIEKMSKAMLAHRDEILQSTQTKKLLAVYNKLVHNLASVLNDTSATCAVHDLVFYPLA